MLHLFVLIVSVLGRVWFRAGEPVAVDQISAGDINAKPLSVEDAKTPEVAPTSIPESSTIVIPTVNITGLTNSTLPDVEFPSCNDSEFCNQISASNNATPIELSPAAKAQQDLISSTTQR